MVKKYHFSYQVQPPFVFIILYFSVAFCMVNYPSSLEILKFSQQHFTWFFPGFSWSVFSFSSDRPTKTNSQCLAFRALTLSFGQPITLRDSVVIISMVITLNPSRPVSQHTLFLYLSVAHFKLSFFPAFC